MRWRKQFIFNQGSHNALKGKDKGRVRIRVLTFIFVGLALLISGRLFSLQILRGDSYTALAMGQHELYKKLFPERGSIFVVDKNDGKNTLFPVVTNQTMMMLYAVPPEIKDASSTATQLFDVLGYSKEIDEKEEKVKLFADISAELDPIMTAEIKNTRWKDFLDNLKMEEINKMILAFSNKKSLYKPIRQRLTEEQVNKIKALNIGGLYFKEEVWRFYPEKSLGGQIFGFMGYVGNDRKGVYGLEGYYNDLLTGQFGEITSEKDLFGNIIPVSWRNVDEKEDGSDIVLTIDRAIQYKACQAIGEAVKKYQAESGTVVVMDPKTGAIIAMCGAPDYDPDNYSDVKDSSIYVNKATSMAYEPGSIFKSFTMAGALDAGKVKPDTVYEDTGLVQYDQFNIRNFNDKVYGLQTMTQVLEKSLNTGVIYAMRQMTAKVFKQYVKDFGFGEKTGVELSSEVGGDINNLNRKGEVYSATASFGQGIMATPLQVLNGYSAIANGGKLMKPYIVAQVIKNKNEIKETKPQEIRQVISSKTSRILSAMLVSVIENGHGSTAAVSGYRLAGKTGTAQVAVANALNYTSEVDCSFAGFGPFNDPKFSMIVVLHRPQTVQEAMFNAAPVWGDIAKFILQYYNIPYDKK